MSRLTVFLARAIGLFTVVLVAALLVRGSAIIEASVADGPVMLVYATISVAMGIAMVLGQETSRESAQIQGDSALFELLSEGQS